MLKLKMILIAGILILVPLSGSLNAGPDSDNSCETLEPLPEITVSVGSDALAVVERLLEKKLRERWVLALHTALAGTKENFLKLSDRNTIVEAIYNHPKLPEKLKTPELRDAIDRTLAAYILGDPDDKQNFEVGFNLSIGNLSPEFTLDTKQKVKVKIFSDPEHPDLVMLRGTLPDVTVKGHGSISDLDPVAKIISKDGREELRPLGRINNKNGNEPKPQFSFKMGTMPAEVTFSVLADSRDSNFLKIHSTNLGESAGAPSASINIPDISYDLQIDGFGGDTKITLSSTGEQFDNWLLDYLKSIWSEEVYKANADNQPQNEEQRSYLRDLLNNKITDVAKLHLNPILERFMRKVFSQSVTSPIAIQADYLKTNLGKVAGRRDNTALEESLRRYASISDDLKDKFSLGENYCFNAPMGNAGENQLTCSIQPSLRVGGVLASAEDVADIPHINLATEEERRSLVADIPVELFNRTIEELWLGSFSDMELREGFRRIYHSLETGEKCDLTDRAGEKILAWAKNIEDGARDKNRKQAFAVKRRPIHGLDFIKQIRKLCSGESLSDYSREHMQKFIQSSISVNGAVSPMVEFWGGVEVAGKEIKQLKGKVQFLRPPRIVSVKNDPDEKSVDVRISAELLNKTPGWFLVGSGIRSELSARLTPSEDGIVVTYIDDSSELNVRDNRAEDWLLKLIALPLFGGLDSKVSEVVDGVLTDALPTQERLAELKEQDGEKNKDNGQFIIPKTKTNYEIDEDGTTFDINQLKFRVTTDNKIRVISSLSLGPSVTVRSK